MEVHKASPAQIRQQGLKALTKELGPVGMVRFLQQVGTESGDYTHEREQWLAGLTVQDVVKDIKEHRQ